MKVKRRVLAYACKSPSSSSGYLAVILHFSVRGFGSCASASSVSPLCRLYVCNTGPLVVAVAFFRSDTPTPPTQLSYILTVVLTSTVAPVSGCL